MYGYNYNLVLPEGCLLIPNNHQQWTPDSFLDVITEIHDRIKSTSTMDLNEVDVTVDALESETSTRDNDTFPIKLFLFKK